jgi:hypothetical protein
MPHVAPWYRREDYDRVREIMDDGDRLPPTFDEWERVANDQLATAAANGIEIKPVIVEPEKFLAYCKGQNFHGRGSKERSMFAVAMESAKGLSRASACDSRDIRRRASTSMTAPPALPPPS